METTPTAENVCRLTGLSARQLAYWDATDFFSPELLDEHRRRAYRIPLQELRRVGEWLQSHHASPWSSLRFALSHAGGRFSQERRGQRVPRSL